MDKEKCRVQLCRYSTFHLTEKHKCGTCHKFGHGRMECGHPDKIAALANPMTQLEKSVCEMASTIFDSTVGKCYTSLYGGMGCMWYAKRDYYDGAISLFFMHSDSWGQYGKNSDDRPKLEAFISGYTQVPNDGNIIVDF